MIVKPSITGLTRSPFCTGCLLKTQRGYRIIISKDNEYALINLSGEVVTCWYSTPQSLLNGYAIELMIPNDNLTLGYKS